jgi:hypothetical protein
VITFKKNRRINMKKTLVSLAAASLIVTSAMAADKGIDIVTTGQAVIYYETNDGVDLFNTKSSVANVGVQLNLNADLGNNFTFGSQLSYLGTAGLEKALVDDIKQTAGTLYETTDELALTKIFVAKKIANTTVKIGRQELPKSLSPLAYSEGWNVFKNTFDAILVVNSDIPDTTLVAAYVGKSSGMGLDGMEDLSASTTAGDAAIGGAAYMLTVQNTSLPMTTLTASYYALKDVAIADSADAIWIDAKVASKDLPLGLKIGLQGGILTPEAAGLDDTTAMGVKIGLSPIDALTVCAAYSTVDDGTIKVVNTGTGKKTPLYTQMIANQGSISLDNDTFLLKAAYNLGDAGKITLQGTQTSDNSAAGNDLTDIELIYSVKSGGVKYLAAYITKDYEVDTSDVDIIRVWARYAF